MDRSTAQQAELSLVVLAVRPITEAKSRPMPEQIETLALTVWPILLAKEIEADEILRKRDLKADEKRDVLFSGISGTQHDHGIHAFVFGPDGKLYFNFGNAGDQLKDKDGKPIIDKAGNEVAAKRQPYQ